MAESRSRRKSEVAISVPFGIPVVLRCAEARVDSRVGVGDEYRSIGEPMTGERRKERINTPREVLRLDSHSPNRGSQEEEPPSFRGPPFFGAMSRKGGVSCCVRPREGAG